MAAYSIVPPKQAIFASAEDVESKFFAAIAAQNLDMLMSVWAEDEEVICIHPTGQRAIGHEAIRESWRGIFTNTRFRIVNQSILRWNGAVFAAHHNLEMLLLGKEATPNGPLHTSHLFMLSSHGWRLVSRHVSSGGDGAPATDSQVHTLH